MALRVFDVGTLDRHSHAEITPGIAFASAALTIGASSVQTAVLNGPIVVVQADEACHVTFGTNPTATTAGYKIAAGATNEFAVEQGFKMAFIQA